MSRYFKKLWPFASIETSTELDSKNNRVRF